MTKPTASSNHTRIVRIEEDLGDLEDRMTIIEGSMTDLLARIDIIIRMGRVTLAIVAAALGMDIGVEGGML
tara:strand:- start:298 stop:510 length:213 start_codon:yes stop_codon:yes gene_type:complete